MSKTYLNEIHVTIHVAPKKYKRYKKECTNQHKYHVGIENDYKPNIAYSLMIYFFSNDTIDIIYKPFRFIQKSSIYFEMSDSYSKNIAFISSHTN